MADILIIEPAEDLALVISHAFARKELSTATAQTSQAAIEAADSAIPRLVVLELIMPRHNGVEFIHEFRSYYEWLTIPIVLYSQISHDELAASEAILKDLGIVRHLYKSTSSLKTLVEACEEVLEENRLTITQ